jgi:hypothetical protein
MVMVRGLEASDRSLQIEQNSFDVIMIHQRELESILIDEIEVVGGNEWREVNPSRRSSLLGRANPVLYVTMSSTYNTSDYDKT